MPITMEPKTVEKNTVETNTIVKKKFYPNYRVLLHNSETVAAELVVDALMSHIPNMSNTKATSIMLQAHETGVGEVIVCAQEPAEMYELLLEHHMLPEFDGHSDYLTVTIEPVDVG